MRRRAGDVVTGLALAARTVGAREAVVFLKGSFDGPRQLFSGQSTPPGSTALRCPSSEATTATSRARRRRSSRRSRVAGPGHGPSPRCRRGRLPGPADPRPERRDARARPRRAGRPAGLPPRRGDARHRLGRRAAAGRPRGTPRHAARPADRRARGRHDRADRPRLPRRPRGGPLGPVDLDVPLDPAALREKGTALGTGALLVVGVSACPLAVAPPPPASSSARTAGSARRARSAPRASRASWAAGRVRRLAPPRPARPRGGGRLHVRPRLLRPLPHRGRRGHGHGAQPRGGCGGPRGRGGCPWPHRRHPDPFAPGSPERTAVEAAVEEQLR
jgi:hypothetical protein